MLKINRHNKSMDTDNDIRRGCIYKIFSNKTNKIYIGSTTKLLITRLQNHLQSYDSYINGKSNNYISSFEIIKYGGDIQIELLESVLYNKKNKKELLTREGEYMLMPQYSNIIVNISNPKPIEPLSYKLNIKNIVNTYFPNY
jgi:hypothetical protein